MANEFKIKKGLIVAGATGGTALDVQGSQGQLFSVTDDLSGSIFTVSDISGVPILDVNSNGTIQFSDLSAGTLVTDANGNISVSSGGGAGGPYLPLSAGSGFPLTGNLFINNGFTLSWGADTTKIAGSSSTNELSLKTASTTRMLINSAGNVGIGTTSPGSKLNIASAMGTAGRFDGTVLRLDTTDNVDTTGFQGIRFATSTTTNHGWSMGANRSANGRGSFRFYEHVSSVTGIERFTILQDGNVGIGTDSPLNPLDVYRATGDASIRIQAETATDSTILKFRNNNADADITVDYTTSNKARMVFNTDNSGGYVPVLSLEANRDTLMYGNVGIGTTSPDVKLHIVGDGDRLEISSADYDLIKMGAYGDSGADLDNGFLNLSLDGSEKIRLLANGTSYFNGGNVGIGTTSPSAKLVISGGGGAISDNGFQINSGYGFNGTGVLEINPSSASHIPLSILSKNGQTANLVNVTSYSGTAGDLFNVQSSGNVGIGTSTPNAKLDVQGTQGQLFSVTDDLSGDIFSVADISGVPIMNVNSDGTSYFDGKVGIGTTSPSQKLTIRDDSTTVYSTGDAATNTGDLVLQNNNETDNNFNRISFQSNSDNNQTGDLLDAARITAIYPDHAGGNPSGELAFETKADAGSMAEAMRIDRDGNVGIGTDSPTRTLSVQGTSSNGINVIGVGTTSTRVYAGLNSSNDGYLFVTGNSAESPSLINSAGGDSYISGGKVGIGTTSPGAKLEIRSDGSAATGAEIRLQHDNNNTNDVVSTINFANNAGSVGMIQAGTAGANNTGYIALFTDIAGSSSERMRVNTNGNVGIGTTSPDSPLEVQFAEANGTSKEMLHLDYNPTDNYGSALFKISSGGSASNIFEIEQVTGGGAGDFGTYLDTNIINRNASSGAYGNINFVAGSSTSASSIVMTIGGGTQKGNVGIGTTSPGAKLDITGNYGDVIKAVSGSQSIVTNFVAPSGGSGLNNIISTAGEFNIGTSDAQPFSLATNSISRITVLSNGNVGINTTSPNAKLNVNGNIKINGTSSLSFGGSGSVPAWAINSSGNDLIINDQATTSGSVLFNNNEGVALPRLTTTQINAISSPTQGLMAYNTTLNTICFYNGSSWQKVSHTNM
jgi:hypothetical protein